MTSFTSPFTGNVVQPTDVSYRAFSISQNTALVWPINGSVSDDYVARIMQVTATATGLELALPPANQVSVGQDTLVMNVGSNTFTLTNSDGGTVVSIAAGQAKYIYLTDNSTEAGVWDVIAFGVGTSNADAAALAGYGLQALGTTLNQSQPTTTFTSSYTALSTDRAKTLVWAGGAGTLTLDATSTLGNGWFVLVRNGGSGALTVATTGGDLFNGSTSTILQPADSCIISCSGTAFYSIGLGKASQFNFTQLTKPVTTGTYTLTSAEAANVILKFTGVLTGNVTVIVPSTVQVYYITNQTSGGASGYTITIKTNAVGATTAVIPNGQQATLICDSVNVINANTILAGASVLSILDGTEGAPAIQFATEPSTGIYHAASGEFNISVLGSLMFTLDSDGLLIHGTGTFEGGIQGGSF